MQNVLNDDNNERSDTPNKEISQEEVQMAISLTEYFQAQRQAYDKVLHSNCVNHETTATELVPTFAKTTDHTFKMCG